MRMTLRERETMLADSFAGVLRTITLGKSESGDGFARFTYETTHKGPKGRPATVSATVWGDLGDSIEGLTDEVATRFTESTDSKGRTVLKANGVVVAVKDGYLSVGAHGALYLTATKVAVGLGSAATGAAPKAIAGLMGAKAA